MGLVEIIQAVLSHTYRLLMNIKFQRNLMVWLGHVTKRKDVIGGKKNGIVKQIPFFFQP